MISYPNSIEAVCISFAEAFPNSSGDQMMTANPRERKERMNSCSSFVNVLKVSILFDSYNFVFENDLVVKRVSCLSAGRDETKYGTDTYPEHDST